MSKKDEIYYFALAGILRLILMNSAYQRDIADRVEVSTPLNSWKRVTEGVYLHNINIDPYSGDLFHETPLGLIFFKFIQKTCSLYFIQLLFVSTDILTAFLLTLTAKYYISELISQDEKELSEHKIDRERSLAAITVASKTSISQITAAYLFNPYIVLNCVGFTTTAFTNLLLSITLLAMIKRSIFPSCLSIALLTMQGLYPICLLVPTGIFLVKDLEKDRLKKIIKLLSTFFVSLLFLLFISYQIVGSWSFINSTIGFILLVPDLRPNVGLYWYFFTEMFEHFRSLFIASFQINVGLLYIVPLALRLRKDPMLLAFSYLSIIAIFKSYPCIGDVGFYMSLIPLWRHLFRHMQQGFIVGCFLLFCTVFAPTVWHQWIYSRSANANFYFGVTLAFAIAQIFLLTDILFASVKREFALRHGLDSQVSGNKAKLLLE